MTAPDKIKQLVETFEKNLNEYRTRKNETELRRQFLDPFFEALGWDVSNNKGNDERRKEVAHELSVEIDGQQKKADYAFRTGVDKFDFLVEAKKPSVRIESNPEPAFQVKRYGWSAKLPINILTDFEHFAVYDCRAKPNYKDKVTAGRMRLFHYKEYIEKWDEIVALFSPDAIRAGALDKYIEGAKGKKGALDVDDDFLAEIERWRDLLARNIANRNKDKGLTESQLNYAVQMTIDRIVFLRIAEERGMEEYGRLQALTTSTGSARRLPSPTGRGENVYSELKQYFLKADERYNSGLFHFKAEKDRANPDTVTFNLQIDDKALRDIIENLYEPKSPYAFAYIPTDILGSVYERFLGKVIRLTAGGQAKVEDKPEVRKAGGVYYTPVYIVEYIVKNTVGKLLNPLPSGRAPERVEGRRRAEPVEVVREDSDSSLTPNPSPVRRGGLTPKEASELKIVDPACGSGSFLLGAYQYLLNWHLDWYTQNDPEKHLKNKVLLTQDNKTYRLSMNEKKRILLNNIHGVDVDPQAVEVTKLSLLLKVVEDPGQLTMFEEGHILPDLGNNIKCGNSLIGMDYFEGQLMTDIEEVARVNPFGWENAFPAVFKRGGFDAVIGNPPYLVLSDENFSPENLKYLSQYKVAKYKIDLFHLFIERGIDVLRESGTLGFITPSTWFTLQFSDKLREYVLRHSTIQELVLFEHKVFEDANVHTGLAFLKKQTSSENHAIAIKQFSSKFKADDLYSKTSVQIQQAKWLNSKGFEFEIRQTGESGEIVSKLLKDYPKLEVVARASLGAQAYNSSKHTKEQIKNRVFHASKKLSEEYLPELAGNDVGRYLIDRRKGQWIKYGSWLHDYRSMDWLTGPRLLIREISGKAPYRICASYTEETYCNYKTILNVNPSPATEFSMKYLLGLLNSKLMSFIYPLVSNKLIAETFPRLSVKDVRQLPIRSINFSNPIEKVKHDQMVSLVERMLALHKNLASAKTPQEKESVQRQVESTDGAIDSLVYELYGLSEEEIGIVDGNA